MNYSSFMAMNIVSGSMLKGLHEAGYRIATIACVSVKN